jgi:hypothetical protein
MAARITLEAGKANRECSKDLWRCREFFLVLASREVSVRYKQTSVGIARAVLRPAPSTLVFTIILGEVGKLPSGGVTYAVLVLAGMLPWQVFSGSFLRGIGFRDFVPRIAPRVATGLRCRMLGQNATTSTSRLVPLASPLPSSFSQEGEDLWLDIVFGGRDGGFYIDVGANHPRHNSNTHRFCLRGWSGIKIEPTGCGHALFEERPRDIDLHAAIAPVDGDTSVHALGSATSLSTLDRATGSKRLSRTPSVSPARPT